jgi:hypothetical protein
LLGRGRRCLLLVMTDEPIGRLHPALWRPGRCWAEIEFTPFSGREADTWLRRHRASRRAPGGATLAELFALADDRVLDVPAAGEAFGFARAIARP